MAATLAQLGARALRKLGIAIVADASRPTAGATVTADTVAARVLLELGLPVAEAARPGPAAIVSQADLASRALRAVGINPAPAGSGAITGITYSISQIATSVLLKLAIIASDESPNAQDQAEALARVSATHDILAGSDYVTWTATTIPAEFADFYIIMASQLTAPQFGKPANMQAFTEAQGMVRAQALDGPYGQTLAVAKIAEVHERMNAAGLVSWLVTAVPSGQAEAYVQMAAALLAPIYGYQQDAQSLTASRAAVDAAEASVRRASVVSGAQTRAVDKVQAVQNEVNALGLVTWTSDAIPAAVVDPLAALAVLQMGPEFGKEFDPKMWEFNLNRIRMVSMGGPAGQALAEQKIKAVHYSLEARGRARWSLYDVPSWAEEPIVLMAAVLLAPECGVKADPNWAVGAEMDLMRIISLPSNREPVQVAYF